MTGGDGTDARDQPSVPEPLRERVADLFVAHRGYEPASFQEALGAVVDVAATAIEDGKNEGGMSEEGKSWDEKSEDGKNEDGELDATDRDVAFDATGSTTASVGTGPGGGTAATPGSNGGGHADGDTSAPGGSTPEPSTAGAETEDDADAPDDGADVPNVDLDGDGTVSFDEYVEGLEETADDPVPAVESILDTEHADGVVRELAAEVLDEMTHDAFEELEHGVDQGVGAGVTDGMGATDAVDGGATAPSGTTGDGVPDSLTADPESDCAVCGSAHRVSVLRTTILEEDGSVALVCPSCAE